MQKMFLAIIAIGILVISSFNIDRTAIAGMIAGFIAFIAFIPYIIAILHRETKPNRATWLIWTLLGFLTGASYYFSGARHTLWVPVVYVVGPFIIAVLSIKYGEGGRNRSDMYCIAGAIIGTMLWWITKSPIVAIVFFLSADLMGTIPTIQKSYLRPEGEDHFAWTLTVAGNVVNLFAVEKWQFETAVYPVYLVLVYGIILFLLLRKVMQFLL